MDIALDVNRSGDVLFVNKAVPVKTSEADVVAQRLWVHLRTIRTEWFLDEPYGVPWFEILGTKKSKQQIDAILQREVLSVQGVKEIVNWSSSFDNSTRKYGCQFTVKTTNGGITSQIAVVSPTI
ncbi:hypothetical protein ACPF8X_37835 [Streptomyces sp. G35A]